MKRLLFIISIVVLPFFIFTACEKENGEKGTLNLYITDAPIDSDGIDGVFITFSKIEYHTSEDGWQAFDDFEGPKTFNLLDLQRGVSDILGNFEIVSGTYTQLRFMLDAPLFDNGPQSNPGCFLEFEDGETKNLFVPSGAQTGYKAVGAFTVPSNGSVDVTADFDVRKSVIKAGASGKYILKPTIRLIVNNQAGQIAGDVINTADREIVIYAYEEGTYDISEAAEPNEEETRFPNAVTSDMVDENGNYYLAYLAPGSYDLVVVATIEGQFDEVLGIVENVEVESKETTNQQINLEEL